VVVMQDPALVRLAAPETFPYPRVRLTYTDLRGWPTGLEPATFGATIRRHLFLGVAGGCRIALYKPISLLVVAYCFRVLRPGWCQKWCHTVATTPFRHRSSDEQHQVRASVAHPFGALGVEIKV
jgi:hypothetical protein